MMTSEHRRRMESLCRQIQIEQDQSVFAQLILELNDLLENDQPSGIAVKWGEGNGRGAGNNPYVVLAGNPQIPKLLASMIEVTAADFGNVQLLDHSRSGLTIVAHQGFGAEFLSYFGTVCSGNYSCGAAMNQQSRVAVSDILTDPLFDDAGTRDVMLRANVRACQSSPLFDPFGRFIGVVSTHYREPREFDVAVLGGVDAVIGDFTQNLATTEPPAA